MYNKDKIINVLKEISGNGTNPNIPYVMLAQPVRSFKDIPAQKLEGSDIHINTYGYNTSFCSIEEQPIDVARNWCFEQALESGAEYLFFVGDDTVIPYDGFVKLHDTAEKNPDAIVVGVYYLKISSPMIYVKKGKHIISGNVNPGQIYEAWGCGLDCALIPTNIIKKIKEDDPEIPFCCISSGNVEGIGFVGEDNFFIHRLHTLGYKILVNTDVQCLHMDVFTGKYTAHPSVDLKNYITNIPITTPLTPEDRERINETWKSRIVKNYQSEKI